MSSAEPRSSRSRRVDDSGGTQPYQGIDQLVWTPDELTQGKLIKVRGFPKDKKASAVSPFGLSSGRKLSVRLSAHAEVRTVKLFRVIVSTNRTEFVATNDLSQTSTDAVQDECDVRWKIEEFHRELKQLTGVEACQCRKARIQRNHIACALLVWTRLKTIAYQTGKTIYQIKHGMLSDYLVAQLKNPSVQMALA